MYNRWISFIDKNKIPFKHQYGFGKNRSTELAIIELVEKITKGIDEGKYTLAIFLDLSKAFNTIDHGVLIKKLECYGIRGNCLEWFKNYLENRKQIVMYSNVKSCRWNDNKKWCPSGINTWAIAVSVIHKWYTKLQ